MKNQQTNAYKPLIKRDQVFDFLIPKTVEDLDLSHGTVLYLEDISVSFDGFQAINKLNFYVDKGELRSLIGPNGAGKTTLMDIVTGKTKPDSGSAWFGQRINLLRLDESDIAQAGIGRKFQKPSVFEQLSVFDNLELSMAGPRKVWPTFRAKMDISTHSRIENMAETINLKDDLYTQAGLLSHGQKQWLEIGMLLAQEPRLLLVDEPAAGMTPAEREKTTAILVEAAKSRAVVVVEHDMEFVRRLDCKVTVLHEGSVLAEGSLDHVTSDQTVIDVYLGRGHV